MASKALTYWLDLPKAQQDVGHAIQAVKLARVELAATRLAAKTVKDSWFITHGTTIADWRREADLAAAELGHAQRGLESIALVNRKLPAAQLPDIWRRAVMMAGIDRAAATQAGKLATLPLIVWPSQLRAVLDAETQARADNSVQRFAQDAIEQAQEMAKAAAPQLHTGAVIAIASVGALVLVGGVIAIAYASR